MDFYKVRGIKNPINWIVSVPGSKSISNRALMIADIFPGDVTLEGLSDSGDVCAMRSALESFRAGEPAYAAGSGTAARFLCALAGVSAGTHEISASPQMCARPMEPLFDALSQLGAETEYLGETGCLPVSIKGAGQEPEGEKESLRDILLGSAKKPEPARVSLDISRSTQFLSALIMAGVLLPGGLDIKITSEKKSGSYVRMTLRMMEQFGFEVSYDEPVYHVKNISCVKDALRAAGFDKYSRASFTYDIEPDVSAAMYFFAAAALCGGSALVRGVHKDSMQGDIKFLGVLEEMGCTADDEPEGIRLSRKADAAGKLSGITVDMNDFSDQALTLAAIAPFAASPVEIKNIAHVRGQECDRIEAIRENLTRAGIRVEARPDSVKIYPGTPRACEIETYNDHRVAMAFSLTGLRTDGIVIKNPECCGKTFPEYFKILDKLYVM